MWGTGLERRIVLIRPASLRPTRPGTSRGLRKLSTVLTTAAPMLANSLLCCRAHSTIAGSVESHTVRERVERQRRVEGGILTVRSA